MFTRSFIVLILGLALCLEGCTFLGFTVRKFSEDRPIVDQATVENSNGEESTRKIHGIRISRQKRNPHSKRVKSTLKRVKPNPKEWKLNPHEGEPRPKRGIPFGKRLTAINAWIQEHAW